MASDRQSGSHIPRPVFNPEWTWGTVLTLIVIATGGVGVWVGLNLKIAEAAVKQEELAARVGRLEQRLDRRLESMDGKIDRLLQRSANQTASTWQPQQ